MPACGSMVRFRRACGAVPCQVVQRHGAPFSHPPILGVSRCICLHMSPAVVGVACSSAMHGILFTPAHLVHARAAQQCKQQRGCSRVPRSGHPSFVAVFSCPRWRPDNVPQCWWRCWIRHPGWGRRKNFRLFSFFFLHSRTLASVPPSSSSTVATAQPSLGQPTFLSPK